MYIYRQIFTTRTLKLTLANDSSNLMRYWAIIFQIKLKKTNTEVKDDIYSLLSVTTFHYKKTDAMDDEPVCRFLVQHQLIHRELLLNKHIHNTNSRQKHCCST